MSCGDFGSNFYPRPPRGGRPARNFSGALTRIFLSTPSARRATGSGFHPAGHRPISIHALREEGDTKSARRFPMHWTFLSTPSARRATRTVGLARFPLPISIHALREEGDGFIMVWRFQISNFYPRPPRGGRQDTEGRKQQMNIFLSTPSARRATRDACLHDRLHEISIHALREEGDRAGAQRRRPYSNFYPRPPRGGRPFRVAGQCLLDGISIHALREEGDEFIDFILEALSNFYPRPPRGGRPPSDRTGMMVERFLSTPSARRATAKTETKSLFSNKLYNILHEFRRALIYNGSKSYPNHAK